MKDFTTYLSTAPVVALIWFTFLAGLLINHVYCKELITTVSNMFINKH